MEREAEEDATDIDVGVNAKAAVDSPADEEPETLEPPMSMSVRVPDPLSVSKAKVAPAPPSVPIITPSEPFQTTVSTRLQTLPDDPPEHVEDTLDTEIETNTNVMSDPKVRAAFISVLSSSAEDPTPAFEARSPLVSASELPTDPVKKAPDLSQAIVDPEDPEAPDTQSHPTLKKDPPPRPPRPKQATLPMAEAPAIEQPRRAPASAPAPARPSAPAPAPAAAAAPSTAPPTRRGRPLVMFALFGMIAGGVAFVMFSRPSLLEMTNPSPPPFPASASASVEVAASPSAASAASASASVPEPASPSASAASIPSGKARPGAPLRKPRQRASPAGTGAAPPPAASKTFDPSAI